MPYLTLARTEKAYNLAAKNSFVMIFDDLQFKPNKLEMTAILKKHGYDAESINVINPYKKVKFRKNKSNKVLQTRPKKYIVTLAKGQKLAEDLRLEA
jgi:ribosomal protein L23